MKKACIVIPTYNEADNISSLIKRIFGIAAKIKGWDVQILVVDDKSPDGTGDKVRFLQKGYSKLALLEGKKQGLGVAYIRGFQYAIKKFKPDIIFEMDADLSHPPKLIPRFLAEIDAGADFVIGSRYVKGGGTPDFTFFRKLNSRVANLFARYIAGMHKVKDCTSGFRAMKTSLIKKINLKSLGAKGYSFQQDLLFAAIQRDALVKEIPLVFYQRTKGESKMRLKDVIEFIINSVRLRIKLWNRLIKFGLVGISGVVVNTVILAMLTELAKINYKWSSIIAIQTAIIWNFVLNDRWTFADRKKQSLSRRLLSFEGISIVGAIINWALLVACTELLGIHYLISNGIGILIAFVWNYIANNKLTWNNTFAKKK